MKVLKNNYQKDIRKEIEIKPYPRILVCEKCNSELEYEKSDLRMGVLGCMFLDCPLCKHDNMIDDNEENITLTADNVEFPTHFFHTNKESAVDTCNNEEIKKNIYKAIDYFRKNKDEFSWGGHLTGNLYINVYRYSGDEMYEVTVSNDFYHTDIPFESEDY